MICRHCGTEIAEKALICYRCGTATAEPRVAPPSPRPPRRRSRAPTILALLALVIAVVTMVRMPLDAAPRPIPWIVIGLAVVALIWRLLGRRS